MPLPNSYPIAKHLKELGNAQLSTVLLERECIAHGLSILRSSHQSFIASDPDGRRIPFNKAGTLLTSRPAAPIAMDKHSTRVLLERAGVPAPRGRRFTPADVDEAVAYVSELEYPVVVKPLHGTLGVGVVTGIADKEELRWAFGEVAKTKYANDDILVEEHIDGDAYRIMVVGGKVVSALISRRGSVQGDGRRTVRELIAERQSQRELNPHLMSRPIKVNQRLKHLLEKQGTGLDQVLPDRETVYVTYGSNTSQGGEPAQVLDQLHPSILEASVEAVAAIPGLGFGGVDFLIPEAHRALSEQRAAICEINSMPAIDSHEYPLFGDPVSVAREMVIQSAHVAGASLSRRAEQASVRVHFELPAWHAPYRRWINTRAAEMELDCRIRPTGLRRMTAEVRGSVEHLAPWLASTMHKPGGPTPQTIEVTHHGRSELTDSQKPHQRAARWVGNENRAASPWALHGEPSR